MPVELLYRTEDIRADEVPSLLVETRADRETIDALKSRDPLILKGSRGVGKSFLLKAAESELARDFRADRVLPVFVSFARAGIVTDASPDRFMNWMIAKICSQLGRTATSFGLAIPAGAGISMIGGSGDNPTTFEQLEEYYETAWRNPRMKQPEGGLPDADRLRSAVEAFCHHASVTRLILLADEAVQVFVPDQQRQFFTLMRDLRTPFIVVKAAVYPGATSYGEFFQPSHDATTRTLDRSVADGKYVESMKEIVVRRARSLSNQLDQLGNHFVALTYAATGNPRFLLKTLSRSNPLSKEGILGTIREYYRTEMFADHTNLAERYPGHRDLIDWGRQFVEAEVLPELLRRNYRRKEMTSHIWVHRDAPQVVHAALQLLCYSGILNEGVAGIRTARGIGSRFTMNLGCHIAADANPIEYAMKIVGGLTPSNAIEYDANHASFSSLARSSSGIPNGRSNVALSARLRAKIDVLDLTRLQRSCLESLGLVSLGDVLEVDEVLFTTVRGIGPVKARQMRNAAVAAVLEYMSG